MSPLSLLALVDPHAVTTEQIVAPTRDVRIEQAPHTSRPALIVRPIVGQDRCAEARDADCVAAPETGAAPPPMTATPAAPLRSADPPGALTAARRATSERDAQMQREAQAQRDALAQAQRDAQALRDALGADVAGVLTPPVTRGP